MDPGRQRLEQQGTAAAVANQLDLTEQDLLANLQQVQEWNGLRPDTELACIIRTIESENRQREVRLILWQACQCKIPGC